MVKMSVRMKVGNDVKTFLKEMPSEADAQQEILEGYWGDITDLSVLIVGMKIQSYKPFGMTEFGKWFFRPDGYCRFLNDK